MGWAMGAVRDPAEVGAMRQAGGAVERWGRGCSNALDDLAYAGRFAWAQCAWRAISKWRNG